MKSSVGKGALILIISGLICKFFGALFRLPLTNILGIEGIGIFQMIMSVYALLSAIVTSGVSSACACYEICTHPCFNFRIYNLVFIGINLILARQQSKQDNLYAFCFAFATERANRRHSRSNARL